MGLGPNRTPSRWEQERPHRQVSGMIDQHVAAIPTVHLGRRRRLVGRYGTEP